MSGIVLKVILCVGAALIGLGSRFIFKKKPDNQLEESMEYVIKKSTGVDVDLSPDTPDKKVSMKAMIVEGKELFGKKKDPAGSDVKDKKE